MHTARWSNDFLLTSNTAFAGLATGSTFYAMPIWMVWMAPSCPLPQAFICGAIG